MTKHLHDKISIIVTSYNQQNLLTEAIDSVLSQTIEPNEIIVIDANSSDGSQALIEEYASKHPEMVKPILLETDPGLPQTRNRALDVVKGDYVAILDGDDRFLPHKIECELDALSSNSDARAVYSNYYITNMTGDRIKKRYGCPQPTGKIFTDVFAGKFGMLRSMLVEYEVLKKIGFLNDEFWHYDGFDMTIELAKKHHIEYVHRPLAEYRLHPGGAAKWRTAEDELPELDGIFERHRPALTGVPEEDQNRIQRWWSATLALFEARAAQQRGEYLRSVKFYIKSIKYDRSNLKKVFKYFLPQQVTNHLDSIYWRGRSSMNGNKP